MSIKHPERKSVGVLSNPLTEKDLHDYFYNMKPKPVSARRIDHYEIRKMLDNLTSTPWEETAVCGEKLGSGSYRDVYALKGWGNRYVMKVERDMSEGNFANVTEWRNWKQAQHWTALETFLCPCLLISEDGKVLIQDRAEIRPREHYPTHIPRIITDTKIENFGWVNDQFVCFDYPYLLLCTGERQFMKKAKWWSEKELQEKQEKSNRKILKKMKL